MSADLTSDSSMLPGAFHGAPTLAPLPVSLVQAELRAQENWIPRTDLGRRLKELRERFIAEGGRLLTADEVSQEVRDRRGDAPPEA